MNLANLLIRTAKVFPHNAAVAHGDRDLYDYRELARRAAVLAGKLHSHFGLEPGDRVALCMHNSVAYLEVLYAIWYAGMVAVPINYKLHPREVDFIVEDAAAALLFVDDSSADGGDAMGAGLTVVDCGSREYAALLSGPEVAPAPYQPGQLAWLFYTSGTTGKPKGVMLSHQNLLQMSLCYFADVDSVAATDSMLYAAPMSHGAGLYNFPHVMAGARHLVPESGGFQPDEILALSQRYGGISMFAAPTMVRRLVEYCAASGADSGGIKSVIYGGGPMYVEDIRQALAVMGKRFIQIYGQGESPMTITALSRHHIGDSAHPHYLARLGSVGRAQSAVEVQVVDAQGRELPAGECGEIIVRGGTVMAGYWRNPAASENTLRDGWLYTGDMGVFDGDGFLTLKDRSKDVIISGGSNIYPREVEEVLLLHPAVSEVSVVGRPSAEWGEDVIAFVVCRGAEAPTSEALDALCLAHIARFKRPKEYRIVASLPKNNYGKVLKTALRESLAVAG
ncbi:MAG TPA: AMP-binding protein [Rhodocyclaceae bacterium]